MRGLALRRTGLAAVVFLLVAIGFGAVPAAADPCVPARTDHDFDQDGFSDAQECLGLDGVTTAFVFPSCRTSGTTPPNCLNPAGKDLFFAMIRCNHSTLGKGCGSSGTSAYADFAPPVTPGTELQLSTSGGLPVTFHPVLVEDLGVGTCSRCVTAAQSAILLFEDRVSSMGTCSSPLPYGLADAIGNPNSVGTATIFTKRIADHMNLCVFNPAGDTTTNRAAAIRLETLKVTAHEATHLQRGAPDDVTRYYGHHHPPGKGCIMDAGSTYSVQSSKVTFKTSTAHCKPTKDIVTAGRSSEGDTHCGDNVASFIDGDGTQPCLAP